MAMNKKMILLIPFTIILVILILFTVLRVLPARRQYEDALMEMIIWRGRSGSNNPHIFRVIVTNDKTLICYSGFSRVPCPYDLPITNNFMWRIRERAEVPLNESDFLRISELVEEIVTGPLRGGVLTNVHVTFLHDGNVYENCTEWSIPLSYLVDIVHELSPLPLH